MDALVRRQQHLESELLRAELTLVRFLPRVAAFVLLQFGRMLEACCAVAAAVGSLLRVAEHVNFEVSPPGAGLATLFTFKWFLPCMDQLVHIQSALSFKLFPAHVAGVRFLLGVDHQVLSQGGHQVESLLALLAGVTSLAWRLFTSFSPLIFPVLCVAANMQS